MPNLYRQLGIYDTIPTKTSIYSYVGSIAHQIAPTDSIFLTKVKLVSLELNAAYNVQDKNGVTLQSGSLTTSPTFLTNDAPAYSESDPISVSYLKYGFQFKKSSFILTRIETLMFLAQDVNSNITLSSAAAAALTGITVDKINKTITVSEAHSVNDVYDYLQWYQSQVANTDLLPQGELFSTVLGNNYTILNGWTLHFTVAPTGVWKVTGEVVLDAALDLTTFNVTGTLFFAASIITTFTDCLIDNVDVVSGTEVVVVTPVGSTTITNNLNPTQITIDIPPATLTITGLLSGSIVEIYDNEVLNVGNNDTKLAFTNNSGTSFSYVHSGATNDVRIQIIKLGYKEIIQDYTLSSIDQTIVIKQEEDLND